MSTQTCERLVSSLTLLACLPGLDSAADVVHPINEIGEDGLCAAGRVAAPPEAAGVDAGL